MIDLLDFAAENCRRQFAGYLPEPALQPPEGRSTPTFDELTLEKQLDACAAAFDSGDRDDLYQDAARESLSCALEGDDVIRLALNPAADLVAVGRAFRTMLVRYMRDCADANGDELAERVS